MLNTSKVLVEQEDLKQEKKEKMHRMALKAKELVERQENNIRLSLLSSMAEGMADTILLVNLETGLVVYANQAAFHLFGCRTEDLLNHPPDVFIHQKVQMKFRQEILRASLEKIGWEGEITSYRKGGEPFISWLKTFCLRDEQGLPWMLVIVQRDLTIEKNTQEQLLRIGKLSAIEQKARETAHEFNNLATILHGYIEVILLQGGLTNELEKDLKAVQNAGQKAVFLARQFLNLAKPQEAKPRETKPQETKPQETKKIPTELSSLVQETLQMIYPELKKQGIQIEVTRHQSATLLLDQNQISQVLVNLIINAQQAMIESPQKILHIETGLAGDGAFIKISDTGCGIPEENQHKIFQPFFTTKNAEGKVKGEKGSGNGLGLSISQKIIEDHGGCISVQSRGGEGAIFTITFTAIQRSSSPQSP